VDLHLQEDEKNDDRVKDMEQELECPRCADIMTLSSEFGQVRIYLSRLRLVTCHEIDTSCEVHITRVCLLLFVNGYIQRRLLVNGSILAREREIAIISWKSPNLFSVQK
jgi:hypothetical protein